MVNERRVRKAIHECVSRMVFSLDGAKTRQAVSAMTAEVERVADLGSRWGFRTVAMDERMIRPVDTRRPSRYGHAAGRRLRRAFVEAFERMARTGSVLSTSRT